MNLNYLPILGWAMSVFFNVSVAIPFWFLWTYHEMGKRFFYWLPETYQSIAFWDTVALFIVIGILKSVLLPSFSHSTTVKKDDE